MSMLFTKRHYECLAHIAARAIMEDDNWDVEYHLRKGLTQHSNFDAIKWRDRVAKLAKTEELL